MCYSTDGRSRLPLHHRTSLLKLLQKEAQANKKLQSCNLFDSTFVSFVAFCEDFCSLQSKKNESIHFMPSLIKKLFQKSEAPKDDGLTQPQREAIVDLLNYCTYADNSVMLAEDRLIADTVAKFNWDPKAVPFDQFDARSVGNARNARESQVYRAKFLASIKERLGNPAAKEQ